MAFDDAPVAALLGVVRHGWLVPKLWHDPITENPTLGSTEVWELFNATADAHPIHIHEVQFQVVNRQALRTDGDGRVVQPVETVGHPAAGAVGGRVQGHGDLVPGRGHEGAAEVPDGRATTSGTATSSRTRTTR